MESLWIQSADFIWNNQFALIFLLRMVAHQYRVGPGMPLQSPTRGDHFLERFIISEWSEGFHGVEFVALADRAAYDK